MSEPWREDGPAQALAARRFAKLLEPDEFAARLAEAYPDFPVRVEPIEIPTVRTPRRNAKVFATFKAAFRGGESRQHGWLKWFAANRLGQGCPRGVEYEVTVIINTLGRPHGSFRGRVLPRGSLYPLSGVRNMRTDVAYFDCLAEVGVTSASSIVEPLWSYAVRQVLWLPFQSEDIHAEWQHFSRPVFGYRIRRRSKRSA